jgi:hypothetical protein
MKRVVCGVDMHDLIIRIFKETGADKRMHGNIAKTL